MENFNQQMIDQETGEVIDIAQFNEEQIKTLDLPRVARALKALEKKMENIGDYLREETDRITELCDAKMQPLNNQYSFLFSRARELYEAQSEKSLDYPGLGKFVTIKGREYVDDEVYQEMTDEQKQDLHTRRSEFFKVKTTVTPDKKAIKEELKERAVGGFVIGTHEDKFQFKVEE